MARALFPTPATSADLYTELVETIGSVHHLGLRQYEGREAADVIEGLGPVILKALDRATRVTRDVLGRYDGASDPVEPSAAPDRWNRAFDLDVDALVLQRPSPGRIADLAFMAAMELRQKRASVERLAVVAKDGWHALEELDSARRRIVKTLTAVATVLAEAEGLEPLVGFASELDRSLEVRRLYARLRASIGGEDTITDQDLAARLRGVGTQIAMLIGRPIYGELRIRDRRVLHDLQTRILAWLRHDPGAEVDVRSGHRLWQDLAAFAGVLSQINMRQELLEHDARVVGLALAGVLRSCSGDEVPESLLARLDALRGADESVDRLLDDACRDCAAWRGPLTELGRRLGLSLPASAAAPATGAPVDPFNAKGGRE